MIEAALFAGLILGFCAGFIVGARAMSDLYKEGKPQ